MIKKFYILSVTIIIFVLLAGCVSIKVEHPDGTKYTYKRWGKQSLENIEVVTPRGTAFNIGKQAGSSESVTVRNLSETALNLSK